MEAAKEAFLRVYGEDYGYPNSPKNIDQIRALEFKRLEGAVYLDHAGATLYSEAQMEAVAKDLTSNVYGNPHSQSDSSMATSEMIRAAREQVLEFCNASSKDYRCVFTSGATSSLKIIGETFPWSRESCYMYTTENHNSVLGIREYALEKGAGALTVDVRMAQRSTDTSGTCNFTLDASLHKEQRRFDELESFPDIVSENACHLFAFPLECNFSGVKYQLELVNLVKDDMGRVLEGSSHYRYSRGHWMVLIDAAKGCATQPPDLSKFPADFVVLSFYKIFGYPTGLGALIVRNDSARLLKKKYFSGGTVSASIADIDFVKRRESIEELLEDGTVSFLSIASIHHGFQIINRLTISAISRHTRSLASYVRNTMEKLRHENGPYLCEIYGSGCDELGPIISFNLRRPDGLWFGYREVEKLASLSGIQLRTGCFCNPGACAKYLGLSHSELLSNIEDGHVCWDDHDILNGKPTGAVRVSFGYMSTFEDAEMFLQFTKNNFLSRTSGIFRTTIEKNHDDDNYEDRTLITQIPSLKSISLYPIKSCSGFSVERWPLHDNGLLHDREWLLRSASGEILTQKKVPEMIQVHTFLDLRRQALLLESPNCLNKLQISLQSHEFVNEELVLYGQRYEVEGYSSDVNTWFSKAIGRNCSLLRCSSTKNNCIREGNSCRVENRKQNFANQAQLLLISTDSVSDLNIRLKSDGGWEQSRKMTCVLDSSRFRPNLVVTGVGKPYAEDGWQSLKIGNACFTSLGGCNRCQIINLDPWNAQAEKSNEPLATLASFRRVKGKILFGILLSYEMQTSKDLNQEEEAETWLEVGQEINILSYNI